MGSGYKKKTGKRSVPGIMKKEAVCFYDETASLLDS